MIPRICGRIYNMAAWTDETTLMFFGMLFTNSHHVDARLRDHSHHSHHTHCKSFATSRPQISEPHPVPPVPPQPLPFHIV